MTLSLSPGAVAFNPGTVVVLPALLLGIGFLIYRWSMSGLLTLDYLRMLFGFVLVLLIAGVSILIVKEGAGLTPKSGEIFSQVLTILSVMAGAFAQWAFSKREDERVAQKS